MEASTEAPGKGLLKTVSILFIIFGAIAAIISLVAVLGSAALSTAGVAGAALGGIMLVAAIIMLIASILELILGIMGLKRSADPHKAGFFITTGIILCVITLIPLIISMSTGIFDFTSLIGFVLPALYIVGGVMNRKAVA